ncbi:nuclear transport factor 2 family protein [Arthrobacter sp. 2MCAF15]|uniref:nuclear transport factor 2 family protein n=1 Tax=Arthrobacter sp. 2MCAF15 TaxID=3232984 RepID=UPI003F8FD215
MAPIPTSELAQRLTAVEATGAVRRTMSRYMDLCDVPRAAYAPEVLKALFSDEAIWEGIGPDYGGKFGRIEGRESICAMLGSYLPPSPHFRRNIHLLGEGHITVSAGTAAGSWIMQQLSEYGNGDLDLIFARLNVDFDIRNGTAVISHFRTEKMFSSARPFGAHLSEQATPNLQNLKEYR